MKDIDFEQELYDHFGQIKDFTLGMRIGKYFYDLGKQSGSSETSNDLEEAAGEYEKKHTYQRYDGGGLTPEYDATLAEAVIFGAKLQAEKDARDMYMSDNRHFEKVYQLGRTDMREQMLKEAVEGVVSLQFADGTGAVRTTDGFVLNGLRCGQKVRIIIVKED